MVKRPGRFSRKKYTLADDYSHTITPIGVVHSPFQWREEAPRQANVGDLDTPDRQRPTPRPRQTMGDHLSSRIALLDGGKPKTHRCGASRHFIDDSALLLP